MREGRTNKFVTSAILFAVFILFTIAVCTIDVQKIGPQDSSVGFAFINRSVAKLFPLNTFWYILTNILGYFAILICLFFAAIGIMQLIERKSLAKVSKSLLTLGAFYALVILFYIFFEIVEINCRPVLLGGELEASYPSSHTVLALCVFFSAARQLGQFRFRNPKTRKYISMALMAAAVITAAGRLFSGAHWFTDICGAVILSAALITLYDAVMDLQRSRYAERRSRQKS